ncbi:MAG: PstS family phosphate ABC transporter substrate-binding protein [Verrucomicrobia bacterium]|nr:PstS family phosphate ABC transporter substrate-binding protein [Cytophagales bacterium]
MKYTFACLAVLMSACSGDHETIKIKGSDTEVNLAVLLAESFHQTNAKVFVSISGGGSGLGIASLLNGTADIANSSRSIKQEEINLFKKKGTPIDSFIFAQDAIAFVVANDLPIDSISTTELAKILRGKYTNWLPITGKKLPINIYGRQSNSGTHDFIKNKLGIDFTPYAKQMNGNAQILEAIKSDHSGIGYVGAGYLKQGNKGIKVLTIYTHKNEKAVSPLDASMIAAGKYFFQRPLFQYYKADAYHRIKTFLDFERSEKGKKIIQLSGYYPAK